MKHKFSVGDWVKISYLKNKGSIVKIIEMPKKGQIALKVQHLNAWLSVHSFTRDFFDTHIKIRHLTDEEKLELL